jgi:tryptophan synthase alpha chain
MDNTNKMKTIMTHLILGYPSFKDNRKIISVMADAGVKYIELQIPFSDPIADGPVILSANQASLDNGTKVSECFDFAKKICTLYPEIKFIFMTYYNIPFNYKLERFIKNSKKNGLWGLILPDIIPGKENDAYFNLSIKNNINPIAVVSPTTTDDRLNLYKKLTSGLIYSTSRIGTTGAGKKESIELKQFILNLKKIIHLPVAVGFGIDSPEKASSIAEYADIIVIGSKILKIVNANPNNYERKVYTFLREIQKGIK